MLIEKNTVYKLIGENLLRKQVGITNLSPSKLYITLGEHEMSFYEINGFPLFQFGLFEIKYPVIYTGAIYGLSDTDDTDIRVFEV